jgi:predicted lipase
MTLVMLFGNALPAAQRKHRLQREERKLVREQSEQLRRGDRLAAERDALRKDAFYRERTHSETWATVPDGAIEFAVVVRDTAEFGQ